MVLSLDRRELIRGAATISLAAAIGRSTAAAADAPRLASAIRREDGSYAIALMRHDGTIVRQVQLAGRGHDVAIDPISGRAVAFARRPGQFAVVFDVAGRETPRVVTPEPNRHLFGHGAFAQDGRILLTTEHDIETGEGVIGLYACEATLRRIGEFPSHGIGPHELILMPDGRTLAVANGGIATDPTTGREPIDLAGMSPSLAFIDLETGQLLARHELAAELRLLSIRHIAASANGDVWFGGQWQGAPDDTPALVGRASRDRGIQLITAPDHHGSDLNGYIGSVAIHRDGTVLAASAPRAGRIVYIDTTTAALRWETVLADGCGVAALSPAEFLVSSGHGVLREEGAAGAVGPEHTLAGVSFDNHLRLVG